MSGPTPALVAILLCAASASAQPFDGSQSVYLPEGVLRGNPRIFGMGGAYVAIAEGAEGMTRNPAAVAQKDPRFRRALNVDVGFAFHLLPPGSVAWQDWDNDGRMDQLARQRETRDYLGTQVAYLMLSVQYGRFGLGFGADVFNYASNTPARAHDLALGHGFASVAWSFFDDALLLGAGIETTHALFSVIEDRKLEDALGYRGFGPQAGVLYRPEGQDFRLGASFRPQTVATPIAARAEVGGMRMFPRVSSPARLLVGASVALGEGRALNITSPEGWSEVEPYLDGQKVLSPALGKWLLSGQVDVYFPVRGATYVAAFLEQDLGLAAQASGEEWTVAPRFGLEKELLPEQIRLRLGTFLEPALIPSGEARWHATFGGEVYLFRLFSERIGFAVSFDLARDFLNLSFGFLPWKW